MSSTVWVSGGSSRSRATCDERAWRPRSLRTACRRGFRRAFLLRIGTGPGLVFPCKGKHFAMPWPTIVALALSLRGAREGGEREWLSIGGGFPV